MSRFFCGIIRLRAVLSLGLIDPKRGCRFVPSGFCWLWAWLGTRLVLGEMFPQDFSDYGRGWAQRGIFRNCSPRFLLILNVVGHRRTFTRKNSLSARNSLEKNSRKTLVVPNSFQLIEKPRGRNQKEHLQCPTAFKPSKNRGEGIKKAQNSAQRGNEDS